MSEAWLDDDQFGDQLSESLLKSLVVFPRQIVKMDEFIRVCEMPLSQIQVLVMLSEGSSTVGMISDTLGIAKPNITPIVNVLCEKQLVERHPSTKDRRMIDICITAKGRRLIKQYRKNLLEQMKSHNISTSDDQMKQLVGALEALNQFAKNS